METETSKSQGVKVAVLGVILLVVLIFNGKIKKSISAWRTRLHSPKARGTPGPGREDSSSPLAEISRILSEELNIPPLGEILIANQELPDTVKRDIFRFQSSDTIRQAVTGTGAERPLRKQETAPSGEGSPGLKLEATLTGGSPLAVINNQPLMPGQSIMGCQLREVRDKQVLLSRNGQNIILTLDQEER